MPLVTHVARRKRECKVGLFINAIGKSLAKTAETILVFFPIVEKGTSLQRQLDWRSMMQMID